MNKIDSRRPAVDTLNEWCSRVLKTQRGVACLEVTAAYCELSRATGIEAIKTFHTGRW